MTPIVIEQTAEQAKLAFELHTRAEIKSVRLLKSRAASRSSPGPVRGPMALRLAHKARQAPGPEGVLRLEIGFRVTGVEEKSGAAAKAETEREPFLVIECTWVLDYELAPKYRPTAEAVKAFKDGNAVFNCWPYFREYVQSTISRMNLPPLTLPLLRLAPKPAMDKVGRARRAPPAEGDEG